MIDLDWVNYGIIAIPPGTPVGGPYHILHFVGYEKKPTDKDFDALFEELRTDKEFGMTDIDFDLIEATPEIVKYIIDDNRN